ncbi:M23 family metallopeptidase [Terrabacter sp. C0L_2]|uniref:M23 family metallopeptidase n=1 Tax=Terrabacter sp. C0L_2 TaxID=3108389 RepID=UPI002ED0201C|nr:M23 family metallopeptidase [Terrabacter sp. C0L_2]
MSIGSALLGAVLAAASATGASAVPSVVPDTAAHARAPGATAGRWAWPLSPEPEVVRRFDRPDQPWLPGHRGIDLAATVDQAVLAPTDGRISWTGVIAGRSVVVVAHPAGLRSTFEPVTATSAVGTAVARGEPVGTVTSTSGHCAPRTCVHWGVLRGETYLDPLSFVGRSRVILLPLP